MSDADKKPPAARPIVKDLGGWLKKAKTLSAALPYMRQFAGQTVTVKYGGHAMGDAEISKTFAQDIVLLKQVGVKPVVVHGGGPQIRTMLERLRIQSTFVDGLRVTDKATVDIVEMVLAGSINAQIVAAVTMAGGVALGMSGKDGGLIECRKLRRAKIDPGSAIEKELDLGFVGEPTRVNTHVIEHLNESDIIPVIAPIGFGDNGETFNINADTAAGAVASALNASRLLMLTDVAGVMDRDGALLTDLSVAAARRLIAGGAISGGMIPKVETCLKAVENGVEGAAIIDGRAPHAVLLELFTPRGAGTFFRPD